MARADLYNEVLKYYHHDEWKVGSLRHALTQVDNCLDAITGLDYEDYLKNKLVKVRVELARQLSCATNQPRVQD